MFTSPFAGRASSSRRQLFAVVTAAFILIQPVLFASRSAAVGQVGKTVNAITRTGDVSRPTAADDGRPNDTTPQGLPLLQSWTDTGLITVDNDWSAVPGIIGYRGDNLTGATGTDPQTITADGSTTPVNVEANETNPDTFATGGVAEFHIANPAVALNGSGTADAPHVVFTLNTTGLTNINVAYNLRDLDASVDNAVQPVALQFRVGVGAAYTNVPAGFVADATTGPNLATLVTPVSATLPASADNQPIVQVRVITANAVGNDEWVGIDDINISGTGGADTAPTVNSTNPADNATGVAQNANIQIVFSEPVNVGATWFQIVCATSGTRNVSDTLVSTANNITFTIDPNVDFAAGELCTVTVAAAQITDQDLNDPPDNMAADYVFDFTTGGGPPTPIHVIQGTGTASPFDNQVVTTTGIVTLLKTTTNNGGPASGFFLQTPDADADADPNTSQGILVFTSSVPTVAVGDEVTVTGTVDEFFEMTEITLVTNVSLIDTGNPLPTAVLLTTTILNPTALPSQPQLEKFEGMRMSALGLVSVAPNDNFFDVETVLEGVARPMREPGIPISDPVPPDPTTGVPDCCIPRWDENPERLSLDTNARAGAPLNPYTSNVTFSSLTGPLDFSFARYRLIPQSALEASSNMSAVPLPSPAADEFTVAGFNIENFNNNATQRQKAAQAIRDVIGLPDIIGVAEIFDLADLQALAAEIQTISGVTYAAHLVEADGASEDNDQDVGFLVKTSRVQINSVTQEELPGCDGTPATCNTYIDPNTGNPALLNDRPPLVLDANVDPSGADLHVVVVVNHLRSFIDIELVTGEGPRVRAKRKAQSEFLADLLQDLQTANPTTSVISVGDYNAYQFNDGYTDPIATIKGAPTADDQVVVDQSPDLVNPNFSNLIDQLLPGEQYSFIFEGTPQALDHVLVNTIAHARVNRIAIARNNSDFPDVPAAAFVSDAARPERCSDHDMPVAYFSLVGPQPSGSFIISEYRLRGSGAGGELPTRVRKSDIRRERSVQGSFFLQDNDEFIDFYNNTDSAIRVETVDGSDGWSLVASDGITRFTIPNGTIIPARGHYLATNAIGYSLSNYPGGNDGSVETFSNGDIVYEQDIPDGSGIAIFNTSNPENFDEAHRLDAVGYSDNPELFREGSGFDSDNPGAEIGGNFEYSFVRDLRSGTHKDTNDNVADFLGIDTQGNGTTNGTNLGAPGPENLFSPIRRLGMLVNLLDPSVAQSSEPNRVRDRDPVQKGDFGTISIRRTVTNSTGGPVTRLRFRIKEITTFTLPPVPGQADIRAMSSSDITVTVDGTAVPVQGTVVEIPPFQPEGGGWNTSWSPTGTINLESPLAAGESINVQFLVRVVTNGSFRIFINVEALP